MKKGARWLPLLAASLTSAWAQTPPIQPQTPAITIPPPISLPRGTAPERATPLSANEAVAIALRQQPDVAVASAALRAARGRTQQSRSAQRPQFSANGSISDTRNLRSSTSGPTANRYSASVGVDQLLFDFGRTRDQVRQTEALERVTAEALGRTNQDLALAVRQAFYTLQESNRQLQVSEDNLRNRQRQLDLAQARLDSGLGAPGDVVRARTGLADAVLALTNARQTASFAQIELATVLAIDPRTPITLADSVESEPKLDLAELFETAVNERPDIREARERVVAAQYGRNASKKVDLPSFNVSAALNSRGVTDPTETPTGTLGLGITWRFSDGGLSAGRRAEAQALLEQARAALVATSNDVTNEISRTFIALQNAEQRVITTREQVANATELVRIAEGRFAGGLGTFLEVTDAQNTLFGAQRSQVTAQNDVQRLRAALRRAAGLSVR